ncbi:electron transfer flavoprotein subunit alpha/FixB family protein [candidate division FCPU426 bacterium]|nr:electron transfer flavoprotein subunit alpha/FixB family protein [candidate division FCPU426 bacterium]
MSEYKDVWIYAEQRDGKMNSVSYELLGAGRKLADDLGEKLVAVLLGSGMKAEADELVAYGADKVFVVDSPVFAKFADEPYARALTNLAKEHKPAIILAGATAIGRSFVPRVAASLQTGMTADCTGLEIDPAKKILLGTRPAYGGNIMATIICEEKRPQMATVRHKVMKPLEKDKSRQGEVVSITMPEDAFTVRARVVDVVKEIEATCNIAEADIIVTGGRGVGSKENFVLIRDLAQAIGGAVGASRAVVDAGWMPYSHQVGQTGKTVCPKIYFAIGVSGAIQHLAGMQSSDIIIAVNSNPDAEIFKVATYGIVGDLHAVVPELIKKFKNGA